MQSQAMLSKEHNVTKTQKESSAEEALQNANENLKTKQLRQFVSVPGGGCPFLTMNTGVIVSNTDTTLKAGSRGPILMNDMHFREKLTHFDHERIPERVVHARGTAAHGYFQMYKPIPELSCAHVFNTMEKTPTFVRFSTVLGSRGSADTVRDVRGFATRFYTQEGNWDIVGNNIPVFFIQDAIKFPDIIHAGKPAPHNEMPQAQTAHDNFWDFISLTPESAHMIMWVLSDRAIPRSYRMMNGFGVNTFTLINAQGKRRFVKFHWKPTLGVHGLVWDEAQKLAGVDPDMHRRDLYEAIDSGSYPEWELGLQIVEEEDEHKFDFDILDDTKIIPEELVPVRYVGKMVLNRGPTEFFPEVEQVAFCTNNVVPGIDFSDDPMLQGRNFSYLDTQLLRLGTPNFMEIPINRPICPVVNNQRDGYFRQTITAGNVNYWPNRHALPKPADDNEGNRTQLNAANAIPATNYRSPPGKGFVNYPERINDVVCRLRGPKFQDHYSQATMFYRSLTAIEQRHLLDAAYNELQHVDDQGVRERMVDMFNNIDHDLAKKVALGIGVNPPTQPGPYFKEPALLSPLLAMERTEKNSIATRKIAFLVADGFDLAQLTELKMGLGAAGAVPMVVSTRKGPINSSSTTTATSSGEHGATTVDAQFTFTTAKSVLFDAFVIVGGVESAATLSKLGTCIYFIREAFKHCKGIMAIGESIAVLQAAVLPGVQLATKDSGASVVNSLGVVTAYEYSNASSESSVTEAVKSLMSKITGSVKLGAAALAFMDVVRQHRYWDRPIDEIAA